MDLETEQLGGEPVIPDEAVQEPEGHPKSKDITDSKLDWGKAGTRFQVYALIAIAVVASAYKACEYLENSEPDPYAPAVTAPNSAPKSPDSH